MLFLSRRIRAVVFFSFFFFNDTATTEIYTLSLHDALPIWRGRLCRRRFCLCARAFPGWRSEEHTSELQSRGLISYAVFCLKKKQTSSSYWPPRWAAISSGLQYRVLIY